MRLLGILLVLAGASVAALAQTNAPEVRKMSLEDCIQSALEKNLDLRIARYNPPMALTDLQAAYAGYDPNFTVAGRTLLQHVRRRFQPHDRHRPLQHIR